MRKIFIICAFCSLLIAGKTDRLKPVQKYKLDVEEPSDLKMLPNGQMLIVSDKGYLCEITSEGKLVRKFSLKGTDFEGVYFEKEQIFVVDERYRRIYVLNYNTGETEGTYTIPYSGARNSAYEGICRNEKTQKWLLAIEKGPVMLRELNDEFLPGKEIAFPYASDISALSWYDGFLWILSEEDHRLFQVNPDTYKPVKSFDIGITGAEGLTFDVQGNFYICSDGMSKIFKFNSPQK